MTKQVLNVVSIRHGMIEENNLQWAKVGTLSDEIFDNKGFQGQQFIEYSVPSDSAAQVAKKIHGQLPAQLEFEIGIKIEKGKPVMVLTDIVG